MYTKLCHNCWSIARLYDAGRTSMNERPKTSCGLPSRQNDIHTNARIMNFFILDIPFSLNSFLAYASLPRKTRGWLGCFILSRTPLLFVQLHYHTLMPKQLWLTQLLLAAIVEKYFFPLPLLQCLPRSVAHRVW